MSYLTTKELISQYKLLELYKKEREIEKVVSFKEFMSNLKRRGVYDVTYITHNQKEYFITSNTLMFLDIKDTISDLNYPANLYYQKAARFTPLKDNYEESLDKFNIYFVLDTYLKSWYVYKPQTISEYMKRKNKFTEEELNF